MSQRYHALATDRNFLGLDKKYSSWESSSFVIVQAPLERTTSYGKGAAQGPEKIIEASHQVEFYDEMLEESPCERGIVTLEAPDFKDEGDIEGMLNRIAGQVSHVITAGKFPVILGGEHTVTAGCVKGLIDAGESFSVLQFDAHSDMRDSYENDRYSHASVMRRVWEMEKSITLCGIRSQCVEEAELIRAEGIPVYYAHHLAAMNSWEPVLERLKEKVYVTIDADFFDPSVMPAVGTPEPGGFFWKETLSFLSTLMKERRILGFDFVELAPDPALVYADFTAARMIYRLIGIAGNAYPEKYPFIA